MLLELRTYRLAPGKAQEFERLMRVEALPLLAEAAIDVVRLAVSVAVEEEDHPEADATLIRAFPDAAERARQEDAFYGGRAWREGPREAILACIESFHTVVLEVPPQAVEALRA